MSRIGKQPIPIPDKVQVSIDGTAVTVKGPKGELSHQFPSSMKIALDDGVLTVTRPSDQRQHRALHGMTRALLANMVTGVSEGFERVLDSVQRDLPRFYDAVRELAKLPREQRHARLCASDPAAT